MLKDLCGKYYHDQAYNCAETIIRAGNEYYNLELHEKDMCIVSGFGGGLMIGNTCGAILSGVSILSAKYIHTKMSETTDVKPVIVKLIRKFIERYGSVLCRDIKPQSFGPEYRCQKTVETACDIIETVIAEYEKETANCRE